MQGVFREVEVAERSDQGAEHAGAVRADELVHDVARRDEAPWIAQSNLTIGLTSTEPVSAPGIIAAHFSAASRSGTSMT